MNQTLPHPTGAGFPTGQAMGASTGEWLARCEEELVHPAIVEAELRRVGWPQASALSVVGDYRRRFNEHGLGYVALLVTTGVAALAAGGAGHTLTTGINGPVDRDELAIWLSLLVCILPLAVWSHLWARRVDRDDPVAVWSRTRRSLSQVLLAGCGVVGGIRLLVYVTELMAKLLRAPWTGGYSLVVGGLNVLIVLGIAVPLGIWAYRFLHRFDAEDPSAPPRCRSRAGSQTTASR